MVDIKLIKNFFIYFGSSILNKIIPFVFLPIITKYLTPQEYGLYGMYQVVLSFLAPFIMMSLQTNITKNFFKFSKRELSCIISSILIILHINLFIISIIIFLITLFFNNPFSVPNDILYIMPLIIYVQSINTFNLTVLRNEEKAFQYGVIEIIITMLNFIFAFILIVFFHKGWTSLVYGTLFAHFIVIFYSIKYLVKKYEIKLNNLYSFKEIYTVSLPLVFHNIGGNIIFLSDRIFIQQMISLDAVGIYMIGNQLGMITMIVINVVTTTINPWLYKNLSKNKRIKKEIIFFMVLYLIISFIVWIGDLIIFPYIINNKYSSAKEVILWISLGYGIRGWYQLFHAIIIYEGKTYIFMYITTIAAFINFILNYLLIKINGIVGAAQATLVAFIIMFIMTFYYANKFSKMN
jgi:O-antigen/teichoic acid export membrane protein